MRALRTSLLSLLLIAVALEGTARLASLVRGEPVPTFDGYEYSSELGWRIRPGYEGSFYGAPRTYGADGVPASGGGAPDRSGSTIWFVGDSITFGFGLASEETFCALVERELDGVACVERELDGDACVERELDGVACLNLGVPGYSSYQGRRLLETPPPLPRPEVVVLAFGANDRRYVLRPADVDGAERFTAELARAYGSPLALRSAALRWLLHALRGPRAERWRTRSGDPELRERLERGLRVEELHARVDPEAYRANLAAAVSAVRELGARPVLLSLPDDPRPTAILAEADVALRVGDYAAAEALLREAAERDNMFEPVARRRLAGLLRETGREEEARAASLLQRPKRSLHGGAFLSTAEEYRDLARAVADERRVPFVDGFDLTATEAAPFLDYCHPDARGHAALAERLAPVLRRLVADGARRGAATPRADPGPR